MSNKPKIQLELDQALYDLAINDASFEENLKDLIKRGANLNATGFLEKERRLFMFLGPALIKDDSLLEKVIRTGHCRELKILIKNNVDLTVISKLGKSAIKMSSDVKMLTILMDEGVEIETGSPLTYFTKHANIEVVKLLIDRKANPNSLNEEGQTALMVMSLRSFRYFDANVEKFRDINAHLAYEFKIIDLLMNAGADVNIVDNEGHTALCYAAKSNYTLVADMLLNQPQVLQNQQAMQLALTLSIINKSPQVKSMIEYALLTLALNHVEDALAYDVKRVVLNPKIPNRRL